MPPEARERLLAGARQLGCPVSNSQADALLAYMALLGKWGRAYNLTAIRDPVQAVATHLLDCLAIVPSLTARFDGLSFTALDVGSGAGLPAVVLAIMLPAIAVTAIDAAAKKSAFVKQVAAELKLQNLEARHGRVEELSGGPYQLVIARAFGGLDRLVDLTERLIEPANGVWAAMKGVAPEDEIARLSAHGCAEVFHVEQLHVPFLNARRCVVWMRPAATGHRSIH